MPLAICSLRHIILSSIPQGSSMSGLVVFGLGEGSSAEVIGYDDPKVSWSNINPSDI